MPIVTMPDGTNVQFPDDMPKEQIRGMIVRKFPELGSAQAAAPDMSELSALTTGFQKNPEQGTLAARANVEASSINAMQGDKGLLRRAAEAIPGGGTGGFADEAYSGLIGAPLRMLTDGVGYGEGYDRSQALQAALKENRGTAANVIGDVAGGLGLGGKLAQGGATLTGRATSGLGRAAAAMGEGAAYGGAYGAGNADAGKRLEEAGTGALMGAATGLGAEVLGGLGSRLLSPKQAPAPAVDELAAASSALYDKARQANVMIKPQSFDKLASNVMLMGGRPNPNLRPNTAGIVDDVLAMKGKPVDLQALDELRQTVGLAMKRAEPQDVRTLTRIKSTLDHFADNAKASDVTGDVKAFQYIKEARDLWARKSKTEVVENLLDLADVDTGKYTQSGAANTIRQRMAQLYRNKKQIGIFNKEEQELIRQMAKGGSSSQILNWAAKLAPRGVVSAGLGQLMGASATAAMGPAGLALNVAIPAVGTMAARNADKGALSAANALRDAAARGFVQKLPQLPNYLRPAIGGLAAGTTGVMPRP